MIGLEGARVLVVDDNKEEALPVLMAFAKRGIPAAFFDGRLSRLPRRRDRLVGVRLAVLDMHLGEGNDANSVASALVKRIELILDPANGPYAVLIWTNHEEYREAFERYIFQSEDAPRPIFTAMITKASCRDKKRAIVLKRVAARLNEELGSFGPLDFVQTWEGLCFEAATEVSNSLSGIAGEPPPNLNEWRREWKSQTLRLLRTLAYAKAEKQLNENNCVESVLALLNSLHADRIENATLRLRKSIGQHAKEIMEAQGECSSDRKAGINSMLHLALGGVKGYAPGNIHVHKGRNRLGWPVKFDEFLASFVKKGKGQQVPDRTQELITASYPLIVEISAVCDFAQNKLPAARFLCGLLASVTDEKQFKTEGGFTKKLGPVVFESTRVPRGQYNLYFSSRQVLALPLSRAKRLRPDARLRGQALSDLQSWFSYQAGRQGVVLVS